MKGQPLTFWQTETALRFLVEEVGSNLVKSITFDRGSEGGFHWKLRMDYDTDTFHCDPYCSWQKKLLNKEQTFLLSQTMTSMPYKKRLTTGRSKFLDTKHPMKLGQNLPANWCIENLTMLFLESELFDTNRFNQGLMKHLLWHNTERPHRSLNFLSPIQFITLKFPKECKMCLPDTFA